jgi:site-specific recombinase XerD
MKELEPLIYRYVEDTMAEYKASTRRVYLRFLLRFSRFVRDRAGPEKSPWFCLQDQSSLLAWLQQRGIQLQEKGLGCQLRIVSDFLEYLRGREMIEHNVAAQLYREHPRKGWKGLAQAARAEDSMSALEKLRPRQPFTGPWGKDMLEFVLLKRRLGSQYDFEERTLADLDRYLSRAGLSEPGGVTPETIHGWLAHQKKNSEQTLHTKRRVAEQFFEYLRSLGRMEKNPARGCHSIPRRTRPPYVLSKGEIREILQRARQMPDLPFFPHRGATYEMIFATLYCLGLRVSEACRLCLSDIDLDNGLLLIRSSKFYKSRLLPVGPNYLHKLRGFVAIHHAPLDRSPEELPLFPCRHGRQIRRGNLGRVLRNLLAQMHLEAKPGRRGPCLHSFRHSFAVHRLVRWYRHGEDVQNKLPFLSAFLGHVDICSTQVYLQMIPELLEQVHLRFEAQCGNHFQDKGGPDDGSP